MHQLREVQSMRNERLQTQLKCADRKAFTLIELLVVVAIIAMLISILLPSLNGARRSARATKCAANLHSVGIAFGTYLAENNATYPPAYVYATGPGGAYDFFRQDPSHPFGYVHWSWFLYNRGSVAPQAFTCPEFPRGGSPRTNPGADPANWEGGQRDQNGQDQAHSGSLEDLQAPRLAYTVNAAVVPRNKFTPELAQAEYGASSRLNRFVQENWVATPQGTILATEQASNWKLWAKAEGGGFLSKNHRSVHPFVHESYGANEYAWETAGYTDDRTGIYYGDPRQPDYGLRPWREIERMEGQIDAPGVVKVNFVGRHHPGGDKLGGTANFLFVDGRVTRTTILETLKKRQWGGAFYSITGRATKIMPERR